MATKYEEIIREIHGKVCGIEEQVTSINGSLTETKGRFDKHETESVSFRRKVDMLWAVLHSLKWIIIFLFGTGVLYRWISK